MSYTITKTTKRLSDTSYKTTPKASLGAIMGALQLGQQVGTIMPDTDIGNFARGIVDPIGRFGEAFSYMGKGKIGKGLLTLIPGIGSIFSARDRRKEEEEAARIAKAEANKSYFNTRRSNDLNVVNAINGNNNIDTMFKLGGSIKTKNGLMSKSTFSVPYGGMAKSATAPADASIPLNANAELLTNPDGSTQGSHETGNNIPILDENGQPIVNAEPGEVVVDSPDGQKDILSKRLGLAQAYTDLTAKLEKSITTLGKTQNPFERNAISREIEGYKKQLEEVVKTQRAASAMIEDQQGGQSPDGITGAVDEVPQAAFGIPNLVGTMNDLSGTIGGFKSGLGARSNFLSNLNLKGLFNNKNLLGASNVLNMIAPTFANAKNTRDMSKMSKDINAFSLTPNKVNTFTPTMDVSADKEAINSVYADQLDIAKNLANPMTGAYLASVAGANRLSNLNKVNQAKNNFDINAKANNIENATNTVNSNIANQNALAQYKLDNKLGLDLATINQRNNAISNLQQMSKEANMKDSDRIALELLIKELNGNKVITRQMKDLANQLGIDLEKL